MELITKVHMYAQSSKTYQLGESLRQRSEAQLLADTEDERVHFLAVETNIDRLSTSDSKPCAIHGRLVTEEAHPDIVVDNVCLPNSPTSAQ